MNHIYNNKGWLSSVRCKPSILIQHCPFNAAGLCLPQQTGRSLTPLSNRFYLYGTESTSEGISKRNLAQSKENQQSPPEQERCDSCQEKNSPVGRNREQLWNPEGSRLFWPVGVKRKYNKWRGREIKCITVGCFALLVCDGKGKSLAERGKTGGGGVGGVWLDLTRPAGPGRTFYPPSSSLPQRGRNKISRFAFSPW